jgi:hypothetical protein
MHVPGPQGALSHGSGTGPDMASGADSPAASGVGPGVSATRHTRSRGSQIWPGGQVWTSLQGMPVG